MTKGSAGDGRPRHARSGLLAEERSLLLRGDCVDEDRRGTRLYSTT